MTTTSFVFGGSGVGFVRDRATGKLILAGGFPLAADTSILTQALSAGLVADADAVYAPTASAIASVGAPAFQLNAFQSNAFQVALSVTLTASLFSDAEVFYAPLISRFVLPALVTDTDTITSSTIALSTQLLAPALLASDDAVYPAGTALGGFALPLLYVDGDILPATTVTAGAVSLAPVAIASDDTIASASVLPGAVSLQPMFLADSDTIPAAVVGSIVDALSPILLVDQDDVPAANVGYRLYGQLLVDADLVLSPQAKTIAYLSPDVFMEEDVIDTYPFFIQAVTGGIPVPPPSGVLTGSISYPRRMTGTLDRRPRLTGSITRSTRVLTGSLKR
jgi:hypothetical protein